MAEDDVLLFADALTPADVDALGGFLLARTAAVEEAHGRDSDPGRAVQGLRVTVETCVRVLQFHMDADVDGSPHTRRHHLTGIKNQWDLLTKLAGGWRRTVGYSPRWMPVPYLDQAEADELNAQARRMRSQPIPEGSA